MKKIIVFECCLQLTTPKMPKTLEIHSKANVTRCDIGHQASSKQSTSPSKGRYTATHSHFFTRGFGGIIVGNSPASLRRAFSSFQTLCAPTCSSLNAFHSSLRH